LTFPHLMMQGLWIALPQIHNHLHIHGQRKHRLHDDFIRYPPRHCRLAGPVPCSSADTTFPAREMGTAHQCGELHLGLFSRHRGLFSYSSTNYGCEYELG